ncbi:MAG: sigma-70 family RNA polymerase sigma factor [Caldilineaceae bacterium]|nr:sigma-70 family RNA polymerase sigma factor [Caldilineaceae bacterium]
MRAIARQDQDAYALFYQRHAGQAYGLILQIVKDRAGADEVLQEAFWQLWERAEQFEERGSALAWFFQIARNRSLDYLRRQKARPQTTGDGAVELADAAGGDQRTPESELWLSLRSDHIRAALAQIPSDQMTPLQMAYFDGKTQQQIAQELGVSLGTVKSRLRLGLEKLEHLLRAQGYP